MSGATTLDNHEIYIWPADDLLDSIKTMRAGVAGVVDFNEQLKQNDTDLVTLSGLMQAGVKLAQQVRLLGVSGRAYIKVVRGKQYIIFKGDQTLRPNLSGTRYLRENAKVRCFVVGGKEILEDAAKGTKVALILFVAIDIAQEVTSDHFSFASLGVRITSDVLQAAISASLGAAAGIFLTTLGAPVAVVFVVGMAVGFALGVLLSELDHRYGLTEMVRQRMMGLESDFERKLPRIRQDVRNAEQQAVGYGRAVGAAVETRVKSAAITADHYFGSAMEMLDAYANRALQ